MTYVIGLQIDDLQIGHSCRHLTVDTRDATLITARTEEIALDPTYTGRAKAGLIAAAKRYALSTRQIVFQHTGGLPGLFGHPRPAQPNVDVDEAVLGGLLRRARGILSPADERTRGRLQAVVT